MRLIDADALRKDLFAAITTQKSWMDSARKGNSGTLFQLAQQAYFTLLECKQHLEKAPTIETPTQPQRMRGRWVPVTNGRGGFECDQCHNYAPSYQAGVEWLSDFCPSCGARMDGGEQD